MGDQRRLNKSHGAKLGWAKVKHNEVVDKVNEHTERLDQHDRDLRALKRSVYGDRMYQDSE